LSQADMAYLVADDDLTEVVSAKARQTPNAEEAKI
jgi:hypothetical protein